MIQMKDVFIFEQDATGNNKNFVEIGKYDNAAALKKVQTVVNCHDKLVECIEQVEKRLFYGKEIRPEDRQKMQELIARAKAGG